MEPGTRWAISWFKYMMQNLVTIDPTDHQNENVDADHLKKQLILEVVGILGDSELDQKNYNFQIIQKKVFSLVIVKKQTFYGAYFAIAGHQNKSCQVGQDLILALMKELLFYSDAFITWIVSTSLQRKPLKFTKYA